MKEKNMEWRLSYEKFKIRTLLLIAAVLHLTIVGGVLLVIALVLGNLPGSRSSSS